MITVKVEQRHIDEGQPRSSCHCPIVLALWDLGHDVDVDTKSVKLFDGAIVTNIVQLPLSARQFIEKFDAGKPVVPFEFTLDLDG